MPESRGQSGTRPDGRSDSDIASQSPDGAQHIPDEDSEALSCTSDSMSNKALFLAVTGQKSHDSNHADSENTQSPDPTSRSALSEPPDPFEAFVSTFKDTDAMQRHACVLKITTVAAMIGPDRTRNELFPFIDCVILTQLSCGMRKTSCCTRWQKNSPECSQLSEERHMLAFLSKPLRGSRRSKSLQFATELLLHTGNRVHPDTQHVPV